MHDITLKVVGDIAGGDYTLDGHGVASVAINKECGHLFARLEGILSGADLVLGNLEGPLSENRLIQPMRLCGIPELANALNNVGFNVLSVANNHILDHGPDVFRETIKYCTDAGLKLCGLRGGEKYYSEPVITDIGSKRIGILAYNWIGVTECCETEQYIASIHDSVVNYTWNRDHDADVQARKYIASKNKHVINDITTLKDEVDYVIIMPHWGYEWINVPPYGVVLEAHSFIDSGADLIVGSHPHVVQGIETYRNKLIAYSLGNFLFDSCSPKVGSGMVLTANLLEGNKSCHYLEHISWSRSFQPETAGSKHVDRLDNILKDSSTSIITSDNEITLDDDILYREFEKQYNRLKITKILYFLRKLPTTPSLVIPIAGKVVSLIDILILRLKGQKVRW